MKNEILALALVSVAGLAGAQTRLSAQPVPQPAVAVNPFAARPAAQLPGAPGTLPVTGMPLPANALPPAPVVPNILAAGPGEASRALSGGVDSVQGPKSLQSMVRVIGIGPDVAMLRLVSGSSTQSLLARVGERVLLPDGKPYVLKLAGRTLNERRVQFYSGKSLVYESDVATSAVTAPATPSFPPATPAVR